MMHKDMQGDWDNIISKSKALRIMVTDTRTAVEIRNKNVKFRVISKIDPKRIVVMFGYAGMNCTLSTTYTKAEVEALKED